MSQCKECGRELDFDEIGLYKKLVNRGAASCMCIGCMSKLFECDEELLRKKIGHFKKMGCTLFAQN